MSNYKFRGKVGEDWWYVTPDDDEWSFFWELVDRDTVGQCPGLQDRNGKDVYEGDIVTGRIHRLFDKVEETKVVAYDPLQAAFVPLGCVVNYDGQTWIESVNDFDGFSVRGNIHDSPEFLEEIKGA